jgi:translocation and assembly module TamB
VIVKRYLRWALAIFLAVLLILTLALGWLVTSQSGFQWIVGRLLLPAIPQLTIAHYEGRLIGAITLQDIYYKNAAIRVAVKDLHFNWHPRQLFSRTVDINTLKASHIDILQTTAASAPSQAIIPTLSIDKVFKQLKLPVDINIDIVELSDATFTAYESDQTIKIQRLALSASASKDLISVKKIQLESDFIDLQGNVSLSLKTSDRSKNNINGALSWLLKVADIKAINGETRLSGNINKLQINNRLAAPFDASIDVSINELLQDVDISSAIAFKNIQLASINSEWPNYQVQGTMNTNGNGNTARALSTLKIIELNKNTIINTQIKSDWSDNQLAIDASADIPGIIEQLTIKGRIQPQLLTTQDAEAITASLTWEKLNLANAVETFSNKKDLLDIDTIDVDTFRQSTPTIFSSKEGVLFITGNLKNYRFSLDTSLATNLQNQQEELTEGQLSLSGLSNTKQLTFENIALSGSAGTLNGQGSISLKPNLIVELNLSAKNLNPAIVSPNWPGDLALELAINTKTTANGSPLIQASLNTTGMLRHHPFALNTIAELVVDASKNYLLTIEKLLLNSGGSSILADATFEANKTLSANWLVSSNNLEELIPNSQGKLDTKGSIGITMPLSKTPTVNDLLHAIKAELTLSASDIAAFNIKIGTLTTLADINWQDNKNGDENTLTLNSEKLSYDSFNIEYISAKLNGDPDKHQLKIDLQKTKGDIDLQLLGQLVDNANAPEWQFIVESAKVTLFELAPWYLQNSMGGILSKSSQMINNHCWLSDAKSNDKKAKICLDANNKSGLSDINFKLEELSVGYFSDFFPEEVSWTNSFINGQGTISIINDHSSAPQQINADIQLQTTAGILNWQTLSIQNNSSRSNDNKPQQSIALGAGSFSITADDQAIKALLKLPVEAQKGFNSSLVLHNNKGSLTEGDIEGKLSLVLDNIEPFNYFIPDSTGLKGKLDSQWRIGGSLAKPWFDGQLALSEGRLLLLSPGILLEDITLNLKSSKQAGIEYQASFNSGGGVLRAEGKMKLADGKQASELQLSLQGERVKVFDTREALIFASPDITITTIGGLIKIDGSITIPEATITPQKIPQSVITSTEDEIIVDAEKNQSSMQSQQNIVANIDMILGDNVQIDGFGFRGATTGSLNIIKQQSPVLANGTINIVGGEYRAFGQGLIIDKGSILFTGGPVTKPGIDIKALRRPAEGITVGVFARGSLSQPDLTIFSEPSMSQSEQLSWLVLGRPLEQSSKGESNAINQLLLSLSLSKGDSLISGLGETFNLDTLRLTSGSNEAGSVNDNSLAELVLGKYLSPELYVSYGIGLFKPVNVLSIEYSLSRYWKLISETSAEISGGDIVYTIEK